MPASNLAIWDASYLFPFFISHNLKSPKQGSLNYERVRGIGLDSRLAVARLGLATGSRLRLMAQHRSAVRFPLSL